MLYFIQNIREDDVRKQLVEYVKTTSAIYDEKHIFNLVDNLLKTGFLEDFRSDKEKEKNELVLNKLKVTNKLKISLFVDEDDAYIKAKSIYPDMVLINDKGAIKRVSSKASAAKKEDYYKRVFYEVVLKYGDKTEFARFCVLVGEMFDPNNTGYPSRDADLGWDKFLLEWESISRDFEKTYQTNTSWS